MCREDSASICVPGRPPPSQNDGLQSSREGQTGLGGMMLLFWPALIYRPVRACKGFIYGTMLGNFLVHCRYNIPVISARLLCPPVEE